MSIPLMTTRLRSEQDVVIARQRARQIAALLHYDTVDQTRLATAVSELARNAYGYGGGGQVDFFITPVAHEAPKRLGIRIADQGPGIPHLQAVLDGQYQSTTGMGVGLSGSRKLVDEFHIDSSPRGTVVTLHRRLPRRTEAFTATDAARLADQLARETPRSPLDEVQQQNHELIIALQEVERRQEELRHLNQELTDTNRGVVALYAELDERAEHLRRMDEMKSHFLSNISHEFRTPVNSVLSLSRFLLDRTDGDLTDEQDKQVRLIQKSMQSLLDMVNDLLDLAKVEAGKVTLHPEIFTAEEMFSSLRGMFRPLATNPKVALVFEEAEGLPPLHTDEGKLAQILRNFISNALKFTESGEVRVRAEYDEAQAQMRFEVRDSGIGIAPSDQALIFEEFSQVQHHLQKNVKGTGLGLPLSRKLAQLLGGETGVTSEPGRGSVFSVCIPLVLPGQTHEPGTGQGDEAATAQAGKPAGEQGKHPTILIVDDQPDSYYTLKHALHGVGYRVIELNDGRGAVSKVRAERPDAVVLDLVMPQVRGHELLLALKSDPETAPVPVIIHSSKLLEPSERASLQTMAAAVVSKGLSRPELLATVEKVLAPPAKQAI